MTNSRFGLTVKLSTLICSALLIGGCAKETTGSVTIDNNAEAVTTTAKVGKQPNVVLILIDDLSHYGVTAYGANRLHSYDGEFTNKEFSTPNIDQLAKGGLRVDRAFAYPICENTRIALMSGKRNDRNYLQPKSQHSSDITFGDAFKKAGYTTGLFGKWKQTRGTNEVAGKNYISEFGWDDYAAFDVITEGQRFVNPNIVVNGEVLNYKDRTDLDPATGRRWYGPDIVNRKALAFIERNKNQPFFLYYPMILVHDDHKPTPDTQPHSIFDNFPEKAEYNNKGGDDRQYFPDMIEYMDKLIGNVVEKLSKEGLRDNTLIVIMGDNGTKESFGHILADNTIYPGRKGGNADNGLHVPLVLNMPINIPSAQSLSLDDNYRSYDGLVNLTDIYPTIAEAANIEMPNHEQVDGISFWQQAIGESQHEPRDHIYTWYIGNSVYNTTTEELKYAFNKSFKRYAPDADFPDGRFFDLRTDPLERKGERFVKKGWGLLRYSGLDLTRLTEEQKQAYDSLGEIIRTNEIKPVRALSLHLPQDTLSVGQTMQLQAKAYPSEAKRQGVVWHSSDPSILSVDKFGEVSAHKRGTAAITVYSWHDAHPVSANRTESYFTSGVRATKEITVK